MSDAQKEFVFTWIIENFPFCLQKELESPKFLLCDNSEWCLSLYPRGEEEENMNYIACYLNREDEGYEDISLEFIFELLNGEGVVLKSTIIGPCRFVKQEGYGTPTMELLENIHELNRNEFLPKDTLTLRCRIRKADGGFLEDSQCLARTHIKIETLAFLWCIKDFSDLSPSQGTVIVKTASNPVRKISFILIKEDLIKDLICIQMTVDYDDNNARQFLFCEFHLLDRRKKKVMSIKKEIWIGPEVTEKKWEFAFESETLHQDRALYLQNDILNIQCHLVFSGGDSVEYVHEFEVQNQQNMLNTAGVIKMEDETSVPNHLNHDLLLMYQEGTFSDVTLQTETENFPAHKSLLCARSPVFRKMFTVDMKEKTANTVQIDDLDADTVRLFLMYIYNDSLENMDLASAQKLYFAGDKYEVFSLREKCAEFMFTELSANNVFDILLLADRHQDKPFKDSVIAFILYHYQEILRMKEWKDFMKSNGQLAAEVMYEKFISS